MHYDINISIMMLIPKRGCHPVLLCSYSGRVCVTSAGQRSALKCDSRADFWMKLGARVHYLYVYEKRYDNVVGVVVVGVDYWLLDCRYYDTWCSS